MNVWKTGATRAAGMVNVRNGALLAASAVAAAALHEIEHRRVFRADLPAAHIRVERLADLVDDPRALKAVEDGLLREWGTFALLGFSDAAHMASEAGQTIFIASEVDEDGVAEPKGALQTVLVNAGGDSERLRRLYPDFAALTDRKSWRRSRRRGGDTAVLLQITIFDKTGRGGGLGSLLRDAVLHMLPGNVKYALTTTPVDGDSSLIRYNDPSTYTPAMRFHARGGAVPSMLLPGYKTSEMESGGVSHGQDVIVMRYARDAEGHWPVARPEMRTRRMGPLESRVSQAAHSIGVLGRRGGRAIQRRGGLLKRRLARQRAA
jgi:hypothetical protein